MSEEKSVFKQAAEAGAQAVLEYFRSPNGKGNYERAVVGVKAGRNFASLYAAQTNRLSTQVTAAKAIGLHGNALIPVFEEISGMSATSYLPTQPPTQRERSDDTSRAGKRSRHRNQGVRRKKQSAALSPHTENR